MPRHSIAFAALFAGALAMPALAQDQTLPTAVIQGPSTIDQGAALTLSGANSFDPGGTIIRYIWTRLEGAGGDMPVGTAFGAIVSTYTVPQTAANPLAPGRHTFQLVVEDRAGNRSSPDSHVVIVADRVPPQAVLDVASQIPMNRPLVLSGARSSDAGGRVVRYEWLRIDGPPGGPMPLSQPFVTEASSITFQQAPGTALAAGRHAFRLVVTDDSGNKSAPADQSAIVVDNMPPTASLVAPGQLTQAQPFLLSGQRSSDVGGRVVQYQWTRVSGSIPGPMPLGQPVVTQAGSFTVAQSLSTYLGVGKHVFRLVVVDDSGNQSAPAEFPVEILPLSPNGR
jgi:hypothetical protein